MTAAWIAVLVVGAATIALKGAGTLVLAGRALPRPAAAVMPLLAPCLWLRSWPARRWRTGELWCSTRELSG